MTLSDAQQTFRRAADFPSGAGGLVSTVAKRLELGRMLPAGGGLPTTGTLADFGAFPGDLSTTLGARFEDRKHPGKAE